jgi:hypothetical protein
VPQKAYGTIWGRRKEEMIEQYQNSVAALLVLVGIAMIVRGFLR